MFNQKSTKAEGIILKKRRLLEKDTIITVFSKEEGKIVLFAKGVQKVTSKRISSLQTGNYIRFTASQKKEFHYLQSVQIVSIYSKIKNDEHKLKQLYFFLFLFDRLLPENQKEDVLFSLACRICADLSRGVIPQKQLVVYGNEIMRILGYGPLVSSFSDLVLTLEGVIGSKIPSFII